MKYYIGIANTCHDPAIAVLNQDGEILFAEAHERYFQKKKAWDMPPDHGERIKEAVETYCDPDGEFIIATPWRSIGLFDKKSSEPDNNVNTGSYFKDSDGQWLAWSQQRAYNGFGEHLKYMFRQYFNNSTIQFRQYDHHLAHASLACYSSPFNEALCLIVDGEGEVGASSSYVYNNGKIKRLQRSWGLGSLGTYYAKITELCGFDWRKGEEGKVMGLAAYGTYQEELYNIFNEMVNSEGCRLHFPDESELKLILKQLNNLEKSSTSIKREDIAYNGHAVFELKMTRILNELTTCNDTPNLVLSGGCALNSAYNGKIIDQTPFNAVHVPSAPADDGNALGAGILAFLEDNPDFSNFKIWQSAYLGSEINNATISKMKQFNISDKITPLGNNIYAESAKLLSEGNIIGWIQGKAEYGPRALGNRSILADPRGKNMKDRINARVKFREDFRPFAPAVLAEVTEDWFENPIPSPYMSFTRPWKKSMANQVPAVVHKDRTGRLQTVSREANPKFHNLISEFNKITNVPILLNTSLNIMSKPIIHTLEDAIGVLYTTGLDALVVNDILIRK